MANQNLTRAKKVKNDEFYTQYDDIEKECERYRDQFYDKVIYCNCDDPESSNFFLYFANNFNFFGIKKLITTHYDADKPTYKLELYKDINDDGFVDSRDIVKTPLKGNGDFRNQESIELLKEADIVITNPPFSLFREYVAQLVEFDKKFLIMGNNNSVAAKEVLKLIKNNKIWLGYGVNKTMEFVLSDKYEKWSRIENGVKYGKVPAISWFTNLETEKRHQELILYRNTRPKNFQNTIIMMRLKFRKLLIFQEIMTGSWVFLLLFLINSILSSSRF
ncbi:MAG: adenine-specific methyltransferase EcoRI family protein [bacterium]|nr:adenine-specific methyltransferase EcoRI family protein [bacterium]